MNQPGPPPVPPRPSGSSAEPQWEGSRAQQIADRVVPEPTSMKVGCITVAIAIIAIVVVALAFLLKDDSKDDRAKVTSTTVPASVTTDDAGGSTGSDPTVSGAPFHATMPKTEELAPHELLFTGRSGANIGNIAMDGKNRFLSIRAPGVGLGPEGAARKGSVWSQPGRVTGFGVSLGTSANKGQYGVNLFIDGKTYHVGCPLPVGTTTCAADKANLDANPPLADGMKLTIIIGESGHVEAKGDYPITWWFTFQPA